MKKIFIFMLFLIAGFSSISYSQNNNSKSLVVYYSLSGNTQRIARRLAEKINADLYEIRTINTYPSNYREVADVSRRERNSGNLPEIINDFPNLTEYNTIYIGGPIWNGCMPTPLERYLELMDFTGKTVIPFSTSMGSGQNGYLNDFRNRVQKPARIGEYIDIEFPGNRRPQAFTDREIDNFLREWISKN